MKKINVRVTDDKPYIFVSYAHADDEEVYPIIEELDRRGYRVWYDEGITPGKVWADVIGKHVMECQIMLLFISENYIKSENCEDEWSFAKSENKNFVCVMLHPTHLPAGMKMQMQKRQMVLKYEEQEKDAFFGKLCSAPGMELCLREPELPEMAEPVQTVKEEVKVKKKKAQRKLLSGDWIKKGIAVVLGVILMLAIIWAVGGNGLAKQLGNQNGMESASEEQLLNMQEGVGVSLSDMTVTADMIQILSQNEGLKYLSFVNCIFEGGVLNQLHSDSVVDIIMQSCTGVDDLSCLNQFPELGILEITDNTLTDGIIPVLDLPKLFHVIVSRNSLLTDLSWLSKTKGLMYLDCSDTNVSDLSPLVSFEFPTELTAKNCPITDITPLQSAQMLHYLNLTGCPVEDPGVIVTCLRLEELHLSGVAMTTLQPFENCTILKEVDISGSAVADVSILQKSAATLQKLNFSNSGLDGEDLQFMKNCANLTEVYVDGIPTEDISFLKDAEQLQTLSASSCGLKDISALEEKRKLTGLNLSENSILDISPLTKWYVAGQVDLALNDNPLTDINALPVINRYQTLDLRCTELDLDTIPVITCNAISVYYSDTIYDSNLTYKDKIRTYHIYDCPPDRQVKLEDYFGYQLELHTSDEVSE